MTMFRVARTSLQRLALQSRAKSTSTMSKLAPAKSNSMLTTWYNTFGKSTSMYASWLIMLIIIGEYVTGKSTDALWTMNNYGKTFETVDWSKFDQFEEEEEDEEDDE